MTQTQQQEPILTPVATADDDPLAHLHKMSTTAGLGSGDYVAVSGTAVFAIIVGLASALALLSDVFLIVPLVGLITAVVALRQITRSNGTQAGVGLAIFGLLLSLGFGGFQVGKLATEKHRTASDRVVIARLIGEFGDKIKAGDFGGAYGMFSDTFKARVTQPFFTSRIRSLQDNDSYGKLQAAGWNNLAEFQYDDETGRTFGVAGMILQFDKNGRSIPVLQQIHFIKDAGNWSVDDLPSVFPQEDQAGRR